MEIDQLGRLRDILEAPRLIGTYVRNTTESDFYADKQKQDAVIRRIEIIGEAAAHVSAASRQAVPELAFRKMRGMRNIVAHDYANVDLRIVWEVATVYVPEICATLEKFFARQNTATFARVSFGIPVADFILGDHKYSIMERSGD